MTTSLYNRVYVNIATTGTGTVTGGSAYSNAFLTDVEAGVANGASVTFVLEEGTDFEISRGVYTSATRQFTRATVIKSKISGTAGTTKMTLAGSATLRIVQVAEDTVVGPTSSTDNALVRWDGTGAIAAQNSTVTVDDNGTLSIPSGQGIELGHATDTTLTRASAGVAAVEGVSLAFNTPSFVTISSESSLTSERALTAGQGITLTDAGANSTITLTGRAINRLINGSMRIWQRNTAAVADDTYGFDRWNNLAQTGNNTLSQLTDVENTTTFMQRITQGNADGSSNHRIGLLQIIEGKNCKDLRGQSVMFSARIRSSNLTTIRYAILEWTGTEDSVTSDFVNDWTSGTYTAGNFFTSTSTTVTATGSTAVTANTLTNISLSGALGSSMNNLVVMIWTSSSQAQNSTLDIGKCQLEKGAVATELDRRDFATELDMCFRYYEINGNAAVGRWLSANSARVGLRYHVRKRTTPTMSLTTTAPLVTEDGVASRTGSSSAISTGAGTPGPSGGYFNISGFTGATAGNFAVMEQDYIIADAEL